MTNRSRSLHRHHRLGPPRALIHVAAAALLDVVALESTAIAISASEWVARQAAVAQQSPQPRPAGPNPYLTFLADGAAADYEAWQVWLRQQSQIRRASLPSPATTQALVAAEESEPNDTQATAVPVLGFGTAPGEDPDAEIEGHLRAPQPSVMGPFPEDDGSIPLANQTGLTSGGSKVATGRIGDGPHGSGGSRRGDSDFYAVTADAGDELMVAVDASFNSTLVVCDSTGEMIAFVNDVNTNDNFLVLTVPAPDTYFVSLRSFGMGFTDPFDSASGGGATGEGDYTVTIGLNALDSDHFAIGLDAGDVIAGSLLGGQDAKVTLWDPGGSERIGSKQDLTFIQPGPFPSGGATFAYVVEQPGTYAVQVGRSIGDYVLELRVLRPGLEGVPSGSAQTLFIDFDGATISPAVFGGAPGSATLSPLSSFLAGWGLGPGDESDVIDAILTVIEENLSTEMRVLGLNGNFDLSNLPGDFDLVLLNSRDHADPFGAPNVSRIIIGGSVAELGRDDNLLGIAETIDPGNFATMESALVLLDHMSGPPSVPGSLNQFGLAGDATIIDLIAAGLGNVASHEAGHFFANFHTDQFNASSNVMDQGGNFPNTVGVGPDLTLGTSDDVDVDFGDDVYVPNEGYTGTEDTLNAVAFGLSTGMNLCPQVPIGSCRTAARSSLVLRDTTPNDKDLLTFKWWKGETTLHEELGDPTTTATYVLCVYDAFGLIRDATAPAGGTCAGKPCWKQLGRAPQPRGYRYKDKELTPSGTSSLTIKNGAAPRPKLVWKAKGTALRDMPLALTPPVVVEVSNTDTSLCLGARPVEALPYVTGSGALAFEASSP